MRYVTTISIALAMSWLVVSTAAAEGMYVGAGIGNTFFSSDYRDALDQIQKIDENSTSWKIFGGFSGSRFLGLEGGYRSFGTIDASLGGQSFSSKTSGWDVEALGRFQVAIVDVFGKAGAMFWSHDLTLLGRTSDESGTDFFWGLGAGARLGPIGARLEWESVEGGGPDNLSMVSLSATLGF